MDDRQRKSLRLLELHRLFNDGGSYTVQELQERFLVNIRTIQRDLADLQAVPYSLPLHRPVQRRWRLDRTRIIPVPPITLTWEQATTLYIAARLLLQHSGSLTAVATGAVQRLAEVLPSHLYGYLTRTLMTQPPQEPPTAQERIFADLVQGWIGRCKVCCAYRTLKGRTSTYVLAPYLFEPAAVGSAVYVRGQCDSDPVGQLRTLKLERITASQRTAERFDLPAGDPLAALHSAWHIWDSTEPPVEVHLRFTTAEVVARVHETVWHPSQQITDLADGSCEWRAWVAETREMLPWIRGWGSAVEVIAPLPLRRLVVEDVRQSARLYANELQNWP